MISRANYISPTKCYLIYVEPSEDFLWGPPLLPGADFLRKNRMLIHERRNAKAITTSNVSNCVVMYTTMVLVALSRHMWELVIWYVSGRWSCGAARNRVEAKCAGRKCKGAKCSMIRHVASR